MKRFFRNSNTDGTRGEPNSFFNGNGKENILEKNRREIKRRSCIPNFQRFFKKLIQQLFQ